MIDDNLFEFEGYLSALSNADLWFWVFFRVNDTRINSTKYHKIHPLFMSNTEFQKTLQRTQKPKEVLPDFSCCIPIALKEISLFFRRVFFFFIMHRYRSTQKYLIEYAKYTKNPPRPTGDFF